MRGNQVCQILLSCLGEDVVNPFKKASFCPHIKNAQQVKPPVQPDGQRPTVAFTMIAQLCGSQANETGWAPPCLPKMAREITLPFFFDTEDKEIR